MLTFGTVIGEKETYSTNIKITKISQFFQKIQKKTLNDTEINIVFHLPDSSFKLDYCGIRDGKFSKKERTIMIQVAVPMEIILSEDDNEVWDYLTQSIADSIKLGKVKFDWYNVEYDPTPDIQALEKMKSEIPLDRYNGFEKKYDKLEKEKKYIDELAKKFGL